MHRAIKTVALYAASAATLAAGFIGLVEFGLDHDRPGSAPMPDRFALTTPTPTPIATAPPAPPTHTKRETVAAASAEPTEEIDPDLDKILLIVDRTIDPYWEVDEAAETWNAKLRCPIFKVVYTDDVDSYPVNPLQQHYRVAEKSRLMFEGEIVHGLFDADNRIWLNPDAGPARYVSAHELGHALGLDHDGHRGTMQPANYRTDEPDAEETAEALEIQAWRCGADGTLK